MNSEDAKRLEELIASLSSSHAAVTLARENLIEALGDRMCGSGTGPTPQDDEVLAAARRREAVARRDMARFVATLARKFIDRVRFRGRPRRSAGGRRAR